jgi:hypothetical protein
VDTLCERAHDGSNLTAYVGVAVRWGDPGTQGKQHRGNINSSIADLAIEKDKHELSLGRCPGPTRTFIVHIWRLIRILERGPIPQNGNVIVVVSFFESGP